MSNRLTIALLSALTVLLCAAVTASAAIYPGYQEIMNAQNGLCLDVTGYAMYSGANVGVATCVRGLDSQRWEPIEMSSDSTFGGFWAKLQVAHSKMCLSVQWYGPITDGTFTLDLKPGPPVADASGSNVVQEDCSSAKRWLIQNRPSGWSRLWLLAPNGGYTWASRCLAQWGWDTTIWDCGEAYWEQWTSLP